MALILVVDDEVGIRELLSEILSDEGHQIVLAENAGAARVARAHQRPDLVLLDIWMPDTDGITLLKEWSTTGQLTMPVVMMSGHGTIDTAVEATRIGALDYLEKPIALQRLLATVKRALRNPEMAPPARMSLATLGSRSAALVDLKRRLAQMSQSSAALMLRGERGMQPELFARYLLAAGAPFFSGSEFLSEPPSEVLAKAAGGVLFIGDLLSLSHAERKGLDFLLQRAEKSKVRVVSFSLVEPRRLVAEHAFDAEFAQRLSELLVALPSVREFAEDVPEVAALMLARLVESRACPPRRLSTAVLNALRQHTWPGNLAQIESTVRNLALGSLEEEIQLSDLERHMDVQSAPASAGELPLDQPYREARDAFERMYFEYQLARENGSMSRVAERTGIERTHLYRKLKALGLPAGKREDQ